MVNKKPRCTFDLRRNCLQVKKDGKINCGNCLIGKKLGVKWFTGTFKVK